MRRLLTLALAAGVIVAAALLLRRLLGQGGDEAWDPASASGSALPSESPSASRKQLYQEAARLGVRGRSKMNKRQLQEAVEAASIGGDS